LSSAVANIKNYYDNKSYCRYCSPPKDIESCVNIVFQEEYTEWKNEIDPGKYNETYADLERELGKWENLSDIEKVAFNEQLVAATERQAADNRMNNRRVVDAMYPDTLPWRTPKLSSQPSLVSTTLPPPSPVQSSQAAVPSPPPSPEVKLLPSVAAAKDTTPPTIDIPSSITVKSDSPTVKGRVSDNDKVVQLTVEGRAVDVSSSGSFSFRRYVPQSGREVTIVAFDDSGNKSEKVVKLTRAAVQTAALSFPPLNPTTIRSSKNDNAIALIIGVANYSRAPAATFADNDANVFSDYAHRALGVPRSNIKVLTNDKASLVDTKVAVKRWLRGRIEEGKTDVHVFFAGHGLASPDGKDLYLLPSDGAPSLLEETSLLRNELFEVIGNAKPKSATIFLDTCYSGLGRGKETLLASARGIVITAKQKSIPDGFTVLSAASGQQISSGLDEAKHGLFSYYLMKGMEGGADANKDKKITAGELHAYLGRKVKKQAIRLGRNQTPELQGDADRVLVRW
jgi:hypothetical protein